tara:strand:- start:3481 stop:4248 length:768 start_codon:yes stop_codon:yes gene_type:complete
MKKIFLRIRDTNFFNASIICVIVLSALSVGIKTYPIHEYSYLLSVLNWLDYVITVIFLFEILVRMGAEERILDFFKKGWNNFDFIIVSISLIPLESTDVVLLARLIRVFRVMRLITFIPEFRKIIETILKAIPQVSYVSLFMFIEMYMFAAIGSILFAEVDPIHWENIGLSMLTLFQVATGEAWPDLLASTMSQKPYSWIYFVIFIIINTFILLNLIVGVIVDLVANDDEEASRERILEEITIIKNKLIERKDNG